MSRDGRIQIAAAVVLSMSLLASTALSTVLAGQAGRARLTYTDRAEAGQPWEVSVGIAMGAFRGIFVNFLWIRANQMKDEGRFFESVELAEAITRLQPRFPRVWVFHAWNLAYNISVQTQTAQERWNWVNAGIDLLRERGIPANPNDMLLHRELGWIFLHKIGGFTDDANPFYKRQLAAEWTIVMGPPPASAQFAMDRQKAIQAYVEWLTPVVEAPATISEVVAREPSVAVLVSRLRDSIGQVDDFEILQRYEMHRALRQSGQRAVFQRELGPRMRAMGELIDDPSMAKAWEALLPFIRRNLLVNRYRMEPERMRQYTQRFGPIDWRHHAAHSLYWSARGVEVGLDRRTAETERDTDMINTDRVLAQSVQDLFRTGELYFDFFAFSTGQFTLYQGVPNPHFVQSYGDILEGMVERSWADNRFERAYSPLAAGYENFLRDAVAFFFRRGDYVQADAWYTRLRTWLGRNYHEVQLRNPELELPLPEFVAHELQGRATSPSVAISQITGALIGSFTSGLLAGNQDLFVSQFRYAADFHRYYMEQQRRRTAVDPQAARMDQLDPDFGLVAGTLFVQFMSALAIDDAERVYDRAPNDLKQYAYDLIKERYEAELNGLVAQGGRPFGAIFPEPRDMETFRASLSAKLRERSRQQTDIEQR